MAVISGGNGNSSIWKWITLVLGGVLATGVTSWFTWGSKTMSRDQIETLVDREIQRAPYPWLGDRSLVMNHISSPEVHENDAIKRSRIRQEMASEISRANREMASEMAKFSRELDALKLEVSILHNWLESGELLTPFPKKNN